jgi:type I restriction enzyme S subunit
MIGAKINLNGEALPEGWSVQLVGSVGEYFNGFPFKPSDWKETGLPIIRIQNLNDPTKPYNCYPDRLPDCHFVRNGDILISWSASLGTFIWRGGDAWLNQHIFKAIPNESKIDKDFFYWAMVYAIDRIARNARGSTMVHVTSKEFKQSELLVPTRAEQRNIARLLGLVRRAIEQQERLLALTAELKKTLLHRLFTRGLRHEPQKQTELGPMPESWEPVPLGKCCQVLSGSLSYTVFLKMPSSDSPNAVECLGVKVSDMNLPGNEMRFVNANLRKRLPLKLAEQKLVPKNTVVFPKRGAAIATNKKRLTSTWTVLDPNLIGLLPRSGLNPNFLFCWFQMFDLRKITDPGPTPQLNKKDLSPVLMPIPSSVAEQEEIAEAIDNLERKLAVHRRKHVALSALFRTLLHELMTAHIRVHNLDLPELETAPRNNHAHPRRA